MLFYCIDNLKKVTIYSKVKCVHINYEEFVHVLGCKMFEVNEKIIKSYCNDVTFNRAMLDYFQRKISYMDVKYKDNKKTGERITEIYAEVSSLNSWEFPVEITLSSQSGILDYSCECEAFFQHYGGSRICKHIAAVLLKYSKESKNYMGNTSSSDKFVDAIKKNMKAVSGEKKKAKLEVKYEFSNMFSKESSIELKIGEDKTYVVKNMKDFICAVKYKNESIEYGKEFTFDPLYYEFEEDDQQLINLLIEIYENDERLGNYNGYRGYNSMMKFLSRKKAYITDSQLKRFFNAVKHKRIEVVINGVKYSEVSIVEDDMPLEFNFNINSNKIYLELEEIPFPLSNTGDYFFFKNKIYKPTQQQIRLLRPYQSEIAASKHNRITFSMEDRQNIASFIVPNLKKISKEVKIDSRLTECFYEEPLNTLLYLDKNNEVATAKPVFKYGDIEISPFEKNQQYNNNKILIRDVEGEFKIMDILKSSGFQIVNNEFQLNDQDKLIDFLTEKLDKLKDIADIYYSQEFKNMKIHTSSSMKSSIRLNNDDLLEFSFDIEGVDRKELIDIFKAVKEKKRYYRLKGGDFVSLINKEIIDVANLIDYLNIKDKDLQKDKIILPKYNALYIDENLKQNNMSFIERNKRFRDLVNSVRDVQEMEYNVPLNLTTIMRPYQKTGFKWLKTLSSCGFGGILADEMGLGKTLQTIAFLASDVEERGSLNKPSLVIAPTSLVYNWESEIKRFAPQLSSLVVSGDKSERELLLKHMGESNIVITSYALIRRDIEKYKSIDFAYCILDEAQQIKNPASISAQSVKELKADGYFALTGTPLENTIMELWSIFDYIMPGYLLTQGKFSKKYEIPIIKSNNKEALAELNKHIKPFILRRLKKEVISELPPKIEHKVVVEMTKGQKKLYAAYMAAVRDEIQSELAEKGFNKSKFQILSALTRLRQICCDPSMFMENYNGGSGKIIALDEILSESINEGHRILLFSQFTSALKIIENMLKENNIDYMYLDGSTPANERGRIVKDFNDGKGSVFLISLKAGGTGLNLTGADLVIHFDPWWNPAVEEQASDRAHRIGQKKTVEVIKLISRGTIEEKIYDLQQKKKELINSVIDENRNEDLMVTSLTEEELKDLLLTSD